MIQQCADVFALNLLILCLNVKLYKTLLILFHQATLKKWWYNFKLFYDFCLKKVKSNSHETHNVYPNLNAVPLNDQQQFQLNNINGTKNYFVADIKERELMRKRLSR